MNNFKQYLEEGRDAPLYHGTTLYTANEILKTNIMKAFKYHDLDTSRTVRGNANGNGSLVVSLSRSYEFARKWAKLNSGDWKPQNKAIVFELDQRKLAQRHKIVPHNWFYTKSYFDDDDYLIDDSYVEYPARSLKGYEKREGIKKFPINQYEENIIGNIKNIDQYILRIIVTPKALEYAEWNKRSARINKTLYNHPLLYDMKNKKWVNK